MATLLRVYCIFLFVFLSGCATLPAQAPPENKTLSWQERQQQLQSIKTWRLKGAIGVKRQGKGFNAQFDWEQKHATYDIRLFGPLGGGQVQLDGQPGQVLLTHADKREVSARDADTLLKEQTGWLLPISNLRYWIRGLDAPSYPASKRFDSFKHLAHLEQQGWQIEYLRYTQVKGIDLPSKITLRRGEMQIKIVIKSWQL